VAVWNLCEPVDLLGGRMDRNACQQEPGLVKSALKGVNTGPKCSTKTDLQTTICECTEVNLLDCVCVYVCVCVCVCVVCEQTQASSCTGRIYIDTRCCRHAFSSESALEVSKRGHKPESNRTGQTTGIGFLST
jgi:hypothetical protein